MNDLVALPGSVDERIPYHERELDALLEELAGEIPVVYARHLLSDVATTLDAIATGTSLPGVQRVAVRRLRKMRERLEEIHAVREGTAV